MLLVLDNCEHLLEACAVLVDALLRGCPHMHILATSREPLGIDGEVVWRVPSLAAPDPDGTKTVVELEQSPAVQLFVERAAAAQPRFTLTERNSAAVVQICRRLDGIPLALELAAARVVALTPAQVVDRLDRSFRLLTGGSRVALPRQQTLQAALDWSYDLLVEASGASSSGWRCSPGTGRWRRPRPCVPMATSWPWRTCWISFVGLVRKSLVVATEAADGNERYRLLETVREYARHKLATRGVAEATAVRERHAVFYSAEVERLYPGMWRYGSVIWSSANLPAEALRERIEHMHDNLRAALGWWMAERRATEGLRLAITLCQFWISRGAYAETTPWLEPMRDLATGGTDPADQAAVGVTVALRARALSLLGSLASYRGQYAQAVTFFQESVALAREVDDGSHLARCLVLLGRSLWLTGAEEQAMEPLEEGLRLGREVGDPAALGMNLSTWLRLRTGRGNMSSPQCACANLLICSDGQQEVAEWSSTCSPW